MSRQQRKHRKFPVDQQAGLVDELEHWKSRAILAEATVDSMKDSRRLKIFSTVSLWVVVICLIVLHATLAVQG